MGLFGEAASGKRIKAASDAAAQIIAVAHAAMDATLRELEQSPGSPLDPAGPAKIFVDFAGFYSHWIDRLAHADLGVHWQPFMRDLRKSLAPEVQRAIGPDVPARERDAATRWVSDLLDVLSAEFGHHTVAAEYRPGALIYEIGRTVAQSVGRPGDPRAIESGSRCAAVGLQTLDAERLVSAAK